MKKLLLIIMLGNYLFAGCSEYINSITINEIYKPKSSIFSMGSKPFVEIASLDGTDINSSWGIKLSTNDGTKTYYFDDVADCSDDEYAAIEVDKDELDFDNGMSISLVDADGNFIDYLVINDNDVEGKINDCKFKYDYDTDISFTNNTDANRDVHRDPDVNGDWIVEEDSGIMAMFQSNDSECDSNDDGSSTFYVEPNNNADADKSDSSCDDPNFNTINEALTKIRDSSENGPFKIKVCTGDYEESLDLNNSKFNKLTIQGKGNDVKIFSDEDLTVNINHTDIEKINFFGIAFENSASCNNGCGSGSNQAIFGFTKNKNSSTSRIKIGNIPVMQSECNNFKFSSDFGGEYDFYGFNKAESKCSHIEIEECDSSKDQFHFRSMNFKLMSDKTDQFGFHFGDDVKSDCNVSLESISLDMNKSSGIRFKELGDFELNAFEFKNSSNDNSKHTFSVDELKGTKYKFNYFHINGSGKAFNFPSVNSDAEFSFGNDDYNSTMISRDSDGLIMGSIKKAKFHNIIMNSKGKGLELDVDGDLNVTGVILKSKGCGFEFKDGNPMFDGLHISSGECDYSFKKSTCDKLDTDTAFIKNSSFGLLKTGGTYPLDWNCKEIELENSCFCPKDKDNSGAISRSFDFNAPKNFWKYLPIDTTYDKDGFKDDEPLDECPHEEFADACAKDIVEVSNFIAYTSYDENNVSDSNMTTKRVGSDFNFTISSIDSDDETQLLDFNGTLCYIISDDKSDNNTTWTKVDIRDSNTTNVETNSSFATTSASFFFKWIENEDKECDDIDTDETQSNDSFATIPDKFILDINNTKIRAGKNYTLEINASNSDDSNIITYEQFFPESNSDKNVSLYFIPKAGGEDFNTTFDFNISDSGTGKKNDFNISDVGKYIIKIIDTDYANVDKYDTNIADRTIEGNLTIMVIPHHFDLNITKHESSTKQDWAYMAQDFAYDMNYTIEGTLTAKNEANETTNKFDTSEYAIDVNTSITFDRNLTDGNLSKYIQFDDNFSIVGTNGEFNTSKETFNKGISNFSLVYRMDKNTTEAFKPIKTQIKDINLTEYSEDEKNIIVDNAIGNLDDNLTWYYSKIKTLSVVSVGEETITNNFKILVYKKDTSKKAVEGEWYLNYDDSITAFKDSDFKASEDTNISHTPSPEHNVVFDSIKGGQVNFNITRNDDAENSTNAIIHINIPKYFWYNYGTDKDYNSSAGTTCSSHPCSTYTYIQDKEDNASISSGEYKGGSIGVKARGDYTKKGIKVFR